MNIQRKGFRRKTSVFTEGPKPLTESEVMLKSPRNCEGQAVTENEINRAVQYVTATTSYGRETVAQIIRTSLAELAAMAASSSRHFTRETLLEYVCYWTIKRTALPEPLVREVLGYAGRWLDELSETLAHEHPGLLQDPDH